MELEILMQLEIFMELDILFVLVFRRVINDCFWTIYMIIYETILNETDLFSFDYHFISLRKNVFTSEYVGRIYNISLNVCT